MNNYNSHFLFPSALYASKDPFQINTILGSCVAVCLYDPVLRYGGMCHYMLPLWNGDGLASPKYGNIAIEKLLDKMINFGSKKHNIKAKIFGGGEVIETKSPQFNIGQRNISLAKDILAETNIPIVSSSVGGKLGRKIIFFTDTGEVKQRFVQRQNTNYIK
ncbi:MAG: chemotaxis protein CheD [Bacteroidales bacterium]